MTKRKATAADIQVAQYEWLLKRMKAVVFWSKLKREEGKGDVQDD